MEMTDFEIAQHWRLAKNRNADEVRCLAELNAVSRHEMETCLIRLGLTKPKVSRKRKIDYAEAAEMVNAGMRDVDIAKHFHVNRATVSVFRRHYLAGKKRSAKKPVLCVETGQVYESAKAAAEAVGAKTVSAISCAANGHTKTLYGLHWRYVSNAENHS